LETALALRRDLGYNDPAGAARLVYSEADGLSGLIVDRYGPHLIVQPTAQAMAVRLELLVRLLAELVQPQSVAIRGDEITSRLEGMTVTDQVAFGERALDQIEIVEHGVRFGVSLAHGHKTGFYLDQRENRLAAAHYLRGRSVLDVCTYTGGFALAAAVVGQALRVIGIDGSGPAIELARRNAQLNHCENVTFNVADCFDNLIARVAAGERYGAVILDPPKFAAGRRSIDAAMRAYHRLNLSAVQLLEPGGILVTCCCSGSVDRQEFFEMLFGVALKSGREIQLLEQHGAAPDHPVNITCPENAYLKCFICRVV
jgi:23S rRNA (cytosine1962-C5)-methyltransferase